MDVGVVGVGAMGQNHARILSKNKRVDSVYIYDRDSTRANKIASDYDCLSTSSLESLFGFVDAVIIATPTKTHFKIAKESLEHGLHTFVEKPICKTIEESEQLCNIASAFPDLINGVGHIERFNPVVAVVKNNIKSPRYISFTRHNPGSDRISDTNVVEDLMIHDIDLLNVLVNINWKEVVIASCGDDNTFVSTIYNGYPIIFSASRTATKKTRELYIEDVDYTIVADLADQSVYAYYKPQTFKRTGATITEENFVSRVSLQRIEPLQTELDVFLECVDTKTPFPVPFVQGHINLRLCNILLSCNVKNNENVRNSHV